jgi:flagellin
VNDLTWSVVGDTVVGIYDNGGSVASDVNKMGAFEGAVIQQGTPTGADADAVLDFSTQAGCQTAITTIQAAYDKVAKNRAQLGAVQAQMESTIRNLANVVENTTAARSRIQDADFAGGDCCSHSSTDAPAGGNLDPGSGERTTPVSTGTHS